MYKLYSTSLPGGVAASGIHTRYGTLEMSMQETPEGLRVTLGYFRAKLGI